MSMNKYGGVNDMPEGFTKTELGKRIYTLWFGMLRRCYDVNQLNRKRGKTYENVVVCDRWFYLKKFYEDIQKLDGYDYWVNSGNMSLDKDIIAQEITKIYSPSTCKFVTNRENLKEMNSRCKTIDVAREYRKTMYLLFKDDTWKLFNTEKEACDFLGVRKCSVSGAWRHRWKCAGWNVVKIGNSAKMEVDDADSN